jgi:lipoprotein-releasing system permease protein
MFSRFEWMIAARYLKARRQESFISVIAGFSLVGICLGVATLIIVMSVMNGFREELLSRIIGFNGHMVVQGTNGELQDYDTLASRIRRVDHVVSVTPMIESNVLASANGQADGALVRGIRPSDLKLHAQIAKNIKAGSLKDFVAGNNIAVGVHFAEKYGLQIGDSITLISPKGSITPLGMVPRLASYKVVATFEVGEYTYDSSFIFMPLEQAQSYFRYGNSVGGLEIFLTNPDLVSDILPSIANVIHQPARVVDWREINPALFSALVVERNVMFLILTLIILVAAFNIISSLIMLVKDKSRDVAILRTMGASRGSIMRIFFIAGTSIGAVGTLIGFVIGVLFCTYIEAIQHGLDHLLGIQLWAPELRFLTEMPARMDPTEVILVLVMALGLSFLATIYPSWRAARLDPVEALRYE